MGDRDSEVAVVIQGKEFASSLRHQIWSVALGINEFAKKNFRISKKLPRGAFWVAVLKTILFLSFSILTERLFS